MPKMTYLQAISDAMREDVQAEIEAGVEEALKMPMPDGLTATDGVFAEREALLSDGNAPWSGFDSNPTDPRR